MPLALHVDSKGTVLGSARWIYFGLEVQEERDGAERLIFLSYGRSTYPEP